MYPRLQSFFCHPVLAGAAIVNPETTPVAQARRLLWQRNRVQDEQILLEPPEFIPANLAGAMTPSGLLITNKLDLKLQTLDCIISLADIFETLAQCMDLISSGDAAGITSCLTRYSPILRRLMVQDDSDLPAKSRQRLLVARAMSISVVSGLIRVMKGSEWLPNYGARARLLAFHCLPATFDGIANRPRGKEAPPNVISHENVSPISKQEEKIFFSRWNLVAPLREISGVKPTSLTFPDFLLFVRTMRFLQNPQESLLEGSSWGTNNDIAEEEDDREEGEEDEDDEQAARRRQKVAEKYLNCVEKVDLLISKFEDIRKLAVLLRSKIGSNPIKEDIVGLCRHMATDPLAFAHIMESGTMILGFLAQIIIFGLKIQFEWPLKNEGSMLCRWADKINVGVICAYRKSIMSVSDVIQACSTSDLDNVCHWIIHEILDFATKYDNVYKISPVPQSSTAASSYLGANAPISEILSYDDTVSVEDIKRLKRFKSNAQSEDTNAMLPEVEPLDLGRIREEFCLSSALPDGYSNLPLHEKLVQRYRDYQEKINIDQDPINEIEKSDRLLSSSSNRFRVWRTASIAWADIPSLKRRKLPEL